MGICTSSCNNNEKKIKGQKNKQNTQHIDISKTVKMFDYNQNKFVEVPVLVPATQNSLYSKRQTHSPNNNHATILSQ